MPTQNILCFKKEYPPKEELEKEIADVYQKIQTWQTSTEVGVGEDLLIGQVFLTCKKQVDVRAIEEFWGGDWVKRMWDQILGLICGGKGRKPQFNGKNLTVEIAPEPNDIFYENLGLKWKKRFKRRIITLFTTAAALGISFLLIFFTSSYKAQVYDDYQDKDEDDRTDEDLLWLRINSILPAIGIIFINVLLSQSIRKFISYERLQTVTEYNSGVALRLIVAQTINTAVIVIAVNYDHEEQWFVPGGLAVDVFYIMLANAFVQPLAYLFDPFHMIRLCRRKMAFKNEYLTQGDANLLFEGPPIDMAKRYSNVMKTFILALLYAPILPVGLLIAFLGIGFEYSIDKYVLLNRHSRPSRMSSDLSDTITKTIPWAIFFYAMMLFIFNDLLETESAGIAFVWMWICFVHLFLPIDTCRRLCRKSQLQDFQHEEEFEKAAVWFFDDYDRSNPVTESEGWEAYSKLIGEQDSSKDWADQFKPMLTQFIKPTDQLSEENKNLLTVGFGKNMMQNNIQSYANNNKTMQQTQRMQNFLPILGQRNQQRRQNPAPYNPMAAPRQAAQNMIINQRNRNMGGNRNFVRAMQYGQQAPTPYYYRQPVAYPPQHHFQQAVQQYQMAAPVQPYPQQPAQYAQQPQTYVQPAQPQYAPQQVSYPQVHPTPYVAPQPAQPQYQYPAQQPVMQQGYQPQPGFQQGVAQYPPAQYPNQPGNYYAQGNR